MKSTKNYWIYYTVGQSTKRRKTIEAYTKEDAIANLKAHLNYNGINNYTINKATKAK